MEIGDYNVLRISREASIGLFLADDEGTEVFLPKKFAPTSYSIGQELRVFVHNDSEGRTVCTTKEPLLTVNQFAMLECRDITPVGAFMNIGIMKDLLVPNKHQNFEPQIGERYLVFMYLDTLTNRLVGTFDMQRIAMDDVEGIEQGDEVDLIVWHEKDDGWRVVVNEEYLGMIYKNQLFQTLEAGQRLKGYVNRVRDDGRLDILLQKPGFSSIQDATGDLLQAIKDADGFLHLTDKSDPELIKQQLGMSKKSFKKAIGALYKKRVITIEKDGLRLIHP